MQDTNSVQLTNDTLKNILIMAPMLDEAGQNKVFGLMCGLIPNVPKGGTDRKRGERDGGEVV
ncbi:MAG: hypothetical protein ACLTXE_25230 [Enterocloster aldenensis]|uniref:hypothetical protein n=1 Tax=Enterocloster sp. TaxID=2719315 RepID=UPI0039A3F500